MYTSRWLGLFCGVVRYLAQFASDYYMLLLKTKASDFSGLYLFYFECMWVYMPRSFDIIMESQGVDICKSLTHVLVMKNKKTKEHLCWWTKEVGNTFRRNELLQAHIKSLYTKDADVGIFIEEEGALLVTMIELREYY